ncbi:MAG: TIGR03545 family protein, partial [Elusimicrobia bacterium]|nr:TIGR03545 family protein [Elusimicrobiota bacterium]
MVKKGNLIFTLVLTGAIAAFGFFFMDPLIKRGIVKAGEAALGAKVDVASVQTQIFKGKISVRGFQAADKSDPWKNLIEFKEAGFQLLPALLLEKKVVIEDASLQGVAWGTQRKTSGELSKKEAKEQKEEKPSAVEKKLDAMTAQTKDLGLARMDAIKGAGASKVDAVKPENLASLKVLDEGKVKIESLSQDWDNRIAALTTESEMEAIKKDLAELKAEGSDIEAIARKIKKAKEIQERIKAAQKNLKETKDKAENDFGQARKLLDEAKKAKAGDLAALKNLAGIPSLDAESISLFLLGPAVKAKMGPAMRWIDLAKKHLGSKKTGEGSSGASGATDQAKAPPEPPKRRGVFVGFPKQASFPAFLWKHSLLSGTATMGAGALGFSGELKDLTTEPKQWGKPLTAQIKGEQGAQSLRLNVLADHRSAEGRDELMVVYKGYPVEGLELGSPDELGVTLTRGQANLDFKVRKEGEQWQGKADVMVEGAQLQPKTNLKGFMAEKLNEAVRSIKRFKIEITFTGREDDLDF